MIQFAPSVAAVLLLRLGGTALLFPKTMAVFVGLDPIDPVGISEIRSTLGSFFMGLGATCLWLQSAEAFTVLGVASLREAIVRLLSCSFDYSIMVKSIGSVMVEVFLDAVFLLS